LATRLRFRDPLFPVSAPRNGEMVVIIRRRRGKRTSQHVLYACVSDLTPSGSQLPVQL
jgi:hypothetical protein